MNRYEPDDIRVPVALKRIWKIGNVTLVSIDKVIIEALKIDEDETLFQQELTEGGIFLRVVRNKRTEEKGLF